MGVPRALRFAAWAIVVLIAVSAVASIRQTSLGAGGEPSKPQEASKAIDSLSCPSGDPILEIESIIGRDRKGGSKKAADALRSFLRRTYPALDAGEWELAGAAKGKAQFVYTDAGARRATAFLRYRGDSWHLLGFASCDSSLEGS